MDLCSAVPSSSTSPCYLETVSWRDWGREPLVSLVQPHSQRRAVPNIRSQQQQLCLDEPQKSQMEIPHLPGGLSQCCTTLLGKELCLASNKEPSTCSFCHRSSKDVYMKRHHLLFSAVIWIDRMISFNPLLSKPSQTISAEFGVFFLSVWGWGGGVYLFIFIYLLYIYIIYKLLYIVILLIIFESLYALFPSFENCFFLFLVSQIYLCHCWFTSDLIRFKQCGFAFHSLILLCHILLKIRMYTEGALLWSWWRNSSKQKIQHYLNEDPGWLQAQ